MNAVDMFPPIVVFTDLDGTLLDHDTYGYDPARPTLARLSGAGFPLVLATSKTAIEVLPLREALGFVDCPAIVENGAGVLEAGATDVAGADTYERLRQVLESLGPDLRARFRGFGDLDVGTVSQLTGLDESAAARARRRGFSEPGLFDGDAAAFERFRARLAEAGVSVQRGGRFVTLSFGADKARRMHEITARYRAGGRAPFVVALGDGENDVAMLEAADLGIVIPNPGHDPLPPLAGEADGRILRASEPGPRGWARALETVLEGFDAPAPGGALAHPGTTT